MSFLYKSNISWKVYLDFMLKTAYCKKIPMLKYTEILRGISYFKRKLFIIMLKKSLLGHLLVSFAMNVEA